MKNYYLVSFLSILIISCVPPENPVGKINLNTAGETPELFAEGIISTELNERDMAISPDGTEIFYSIFSYDNTIRVLMFMQLGKAGWSLPAPAPFAGEYFDLEPAFSPDGQTLYFVSNRPLSPNDSTRDHNIWFVQRDSSGWSLPKAMDPVINTEAEEYYPSVTASGNFYFTASYPDARGKEDIYVSRFTDGKYSKPEPLDSAINSVGWEFNAYVSPDEKILIFSSFGRPDGLGGGDLYLSTKDETGNWTPARNLEAPINSSKLDYCPLIDWPRNTFYFTSNRTADPPKYITSIEELHSLAGGPLNGMGNIYRVSLEALNLP